MVTISKSKPVLTMIYEFDGLDADKQSTLASGLRPLIANLISKQTGFVSNALHLSMDGVKVLNYFQWENKEVFDAFRANEALQSQIKPVVGPYSPKPRVYDIVASAGDATVGQGQDVFTVIFECDIKPDQKDGLVNGLTEIVSTIVSKQPGFVSANLHVSKDGEKVLNYLQWKNKEAFETFRGNAELQAKIKPVTSPYGPKPRVYQIPSSTGK
jgi:quinol monooxygenase YgiN